MTTYPITGCLIPLGIQGEKNTRRFAFDITGYEDYDIIIAYRRPGSDIPYYVETAKEESLLYWITEASDVEFPGSGTAVMRFYKGEELRKSCAFETVVRADPLLDVGDPPEDFETWFDRLSELALSANQSADSARSSSASAAASAAEAGGHASAAERFAGTAAGAAGTAVSAASSAEFSESAAKSAQAEAQTAASRAGQNAVASEQAAENAQAAQLEAEKAAGEIKGITASAETLPTGSSASAAYDPATGNLLFGIPAGARGAPGNPGKTPVKGVDYFTPSEVNDIASAAAQKVPAPDLSGYAKTTDLTAEVTRATNTERQLGEGLNQLNEDIVEQGEEIAKTSESLTVLAEITTVDGSSDSYNVVTPTQRGNDDEAIASGGQLQTGKTGKIYNMYSVTSGETYYVSGMCNGYAYNGNYSAPLIVFKNDSNAVVSFYVGTETNINVAVVDKEIIVPSGASKMFVNGTYQTIGQVNQPPIAKKRNAITKRVLKKWSPLYDKSVYFVGDSVCAGAENATSYADLISEKYNMVMTKDAKSGTKLVTTDPNSICGRVQTVTDTYDYVIIEGGFNDMFANEPIGTLTNGFIGTNFDTTTVIGAVEKIFAVLYLSNPEAKKLFILPHRKTLANYWSGNVQKNYWDAIKSACVKWSVPCLDLAECSGLAIWGSSFEKYFAEPQGTHPLIEGYKKFYCPKIESAMEAL